MISRPAALSPAPSTGRSTRATFPTDGYRSRLAGPRIDSGGQSGATAIQAHHQAAAQAETEPTAGRTPTSGEPNKAQPAPPRPHPSAVKPAKPVERPVIATKTIGEESDQGVAPRPPARLASAAAVARFGSPGSSSDEKAPGARKTADSHSGGTALANAPVSGVALVAATGSPPQRATRRHAIRRWLASAASKGECCYA